MMLRTTARPAPASGADTLARLVASMQPDLVQVERSLAEVSRSGRRVGRCVDQILLRKGKRLRPMCVILAARLGRGAGPAGHSLAVASELLHGATLLHDDVIDEADHRRGAPSGRALEGNAASVLAGDWLLTSALFHVRAAGLPDVLDDFLRVLEVLVAAEALQLDRRGRLDPDVACYERIVEGKTAALFGFCLSAGARVGGVDPMWRGALERYACHLGQAFQLTDDLLDYAGDPAKTGKALYEDLRQGKATYPLILGLKRDPRIASAISEGLDSTVTDWRLLGAHVRRRLESVGALSDAREQAHALARDAADALAHLPMCEASEALATLAATVGSRADEAAR